jgi:hypothetical protein
MQGAGREGMAGRCAHTREGGSCDDELLQSLWHCASAKESADARAPNMKLERRLDKRITRSG